MKLGDNSVSFRGFYVVQINDSVQILSVQALRCVEDDALQLINTLLSCMQFCIHFKSIWFAAVQAATEQHPGVMQEVFPFVPLLLTWRGDRSRHVYIG